MPNEFAVVGEHRDNETQLLVIGMDGRYYDYDPRREHLTPVEVDDRWILFEDMAEALDGHPSPTLPETSLSPQ